MTKEKVLHLALSLLAACVPVLVTTFPALPPVLVSMLSLLAAYFGGAKLLKAPSQ